MSGALPDRAQAVIIGGGIHGCSVAYHLAKAGWSDVILLERKQLTSGTTWHAAGLVGQLQGSHATTAFASYGVELLQEIEAETGQNPGFRQNGSISIALNDQRMAERWPLMNAEGVLGGIFMPGDGAANPSDLTQALAKGARMNGARLFEHTPVEEVLTEGGEVCGVCTGEGVIKTDICLLYTSPSPRDS